MRAVTSLAELTAGECALLRVDPFTGVPINEAGEWLSRGRHTYLCFGSERDARDHAQQQLHLNRLFEFILYSQTGEHLAVLHDDAALAEHQSRR